MVGTRRCKMISSFTKNATRGKATQSNTECLPEDVPSRACSHTSIVAVPFEIKSYNMSALKGAWTLTEMFGVRRVGELQRCHTRQYGLHIPRQFMSPAGHLHSPSMQTLSVGQTQGQSAKEEEQCPNRQQTGACSGQFAPFAVLHEAHECVLLRTTKSLHVPSPAGCCRHQLFDGGGWRWTRPNNYAVNGVICQVHPPCSVPCAQQLPLGH